MIKPKTVQELFSDESRWTRYALAANKNGDVVDLNSDNATCFCFGGAILRVYGDVYQGYAVLERVAKLLRKKGAVLGSNRGNISTIARWNDNPKRTFQDVRSLAAEANI